MLRDRRLYPLSFLHTCSFGVSIVAGEWIVSLLTHSGYSHRRAALAGALTLIGGLVTRPGGGIVLQRRPDRARAVVAGAVAVCATRDPRAREPRAAAGARRSRRSRSGLAAGIPFAAVFRGAQILRPDAAGTRGRPRQRGAEPLHPDRDAARRAHVLAPGRRPARLRRARCCRARRPRAVAPVVLSRAVSSRDAELRRHRPARPAVPAPDRADAARREPRLRVRLDVRLARPLAGVDSAADARRRADRRRSSSGTA